MFLCFDGSWEVWFLFFPFLMGFGWFPCPPFEPPSEKPGSGEVADRGAFTGIAPGLEGRKAMVVPPILSPPRGGRLVSPGIGSSCPFPPLVHEGVLEEGGQRS